MKYRRYIQGNRRGKEANRIEKEAMKDPFLAEALEGYERAKENPAKRIRDIRKQITHSTRRRHFKIRNWSIAASLLVLLGFGSYFFMYDDTILTEYSTIASEETMDTIYAEEEIQVNREQSQPTENALALNMEKQKTPPPPPAPVIITENDLNISDYQSEISEDVAIEAESEILDAAKIIKQTDIVSETNAISAKKDALAAVTASPSTPAFSSNPSHKVKGQVTDDKGEPIPGASILLEGTNNGALTDMDGYFVLEVPGQGKIKVNYIGYESITLPIDSAQQTLHIAMHESQQYLDEVVITQRSAKEIKASVTSQPVIGNKAYKKYIEENLIRPSDDECNKIKGKVSLTFFINEKGRPYNIRIQKPLCPSADKEAIRLIEEGPDWTIGNQEVKWDIKF